jgi:SAM-dependent methyltransferase
MDRWRYFHISHTDHDILNPLSSAKMDELVELIGPLDGGRVLDIACGKAEPLTRIVERYDVSAAGVDLSPPFVAAARERVAERTPGADVEIVELDGASYDPGDDRFDVALCLGASWIWGGFEGTLKALAGFVRPGGLVVSGEPYWKQTPAEEYLKREGLRADTFGTHAKNVQVGLDLGLNLEYALVSSDGDFDRYEALQWRATERFAVSHPADPDVADVLERCRSSRESYLGWGRDTLGWAVYVFATPQ